MCFLKELFYQEKEFLSLLNKRKMFTVFIIPVHLLPFKYFCLSLKHFQNPKLLAPNGCRCWLVISLSCPVYRWSEGDLLCLAERRFLGRLHWSLLWPGSKTPHTVPLYKHINWVHQTFRKEDFVIYLRSLIKSRGCYTVDISVLKTCGIRSWAGLTARTLMVECVFLLSSLGRTPTTRCLRRTTGTVTWDFTSRTSAAAEWSSTLCGEPTSLWERYSPTHLQTATSWRGC